MNPCQKKKKNRHIQSKGAISCIWVEPSNCMYVLWRPAARHWLKWHSLLSNPPSSVPISAFSQDEGKLELGGVFFFFFTLQPTLQRIMKWNSTAEYLTLWMLQVVAGKRATSYRFPLSLCYLSTALVCIYVGLCLEASRVMPRSLFSDLLSYCLCSWLHSRTLWFVLSFKQVSNMQVLENIRSHYCVHATHSCSLWLTFFIV